MSDYFQWRKPKKDRQHTETFFFGPKFGLRQIGRPWPEAPLACQSAYRPTSPVGVNAKNPGSQLMSQLELVMCAMCT